MSKIKVYWHTCKRCRKKNGNYYIQERGPHIGIYCEACNQWTQWLGKDLLVHFMEYKNINHLYNRFHEEIEIGDIIPQAPKIHLSDFKDVTGQDIEGLPF